MPLINLIVVLVVVGVILWLVNTYVPMQQPFKTLRQLRGGGRRRDRRAG